jgi:hypothetical protein
MRLSWAAGTKSTLAWRPHSLSFPGRATVPWRKEEECAADLLEVL